MSSEVTRCPACDAAIDEETGSCPDCGADLRKTETEPPAPQAAAETGVESQQGTQTAEQQEDTEGCPVCGEPLHAAPDKQEGYCSRCGAHLLRHRSTGVWVASVADTSSTPGLAVAGFILSLLGLVLFWLPFLLGVAMLVTGVVLAANGRSQAKKIKAPTGLATAGIVLGLVGIGLWLLFVVLLGVALLSS